MLAKLVSKNPAITRSATLWSALCLAFMAGAPANAHAVDSLKLSNQIEQSRSKDKQLQQQVDSNQSKASQYQGRIDELRSQLQGVQSRLDVDQGKLDKLQIELRVTRQKLVKLKAQDELDQKTLEEQLVAQYEEPRPNIASVLVNSKNFDQLIDNMDSAAAAANSNAQITKRVAAERKRIAVETRALSKAESKQAEITAALQTQRDAVAQVKLQVVEQQLVWLKKSNAAKSKLSVLRTSRKDLESELAKIQAKQLASIGVSGSGSASGAGLFLAPGTNYRFGNTPEIARRLQKMAVSLRLHLIGLSGYRTPQHSMEVGGFANDPHTKGEASDTPGLEGVPEATLNKYGLTRPFPGAAEADHVQLLGSTAR